MSLFWAWRVSQAGQPATRQQMTLSELTDGDVLIQVHYSSLNYKDALAITGKGRILRRFPLNAGIDLSGVVLESRDSRFAVGQKIVAHGCGIGEDRDGGLSERVRLPGNMLMPLPEGLSLSEAMILGTAGFTAALALRRMEHNGQRPALGPILITGASGGVGSFAVQMFSGAGFEVFAVSGKPAAVAYLKDLGATQVITPDALALGARPLESVRFGGAVDNVGGELLAKVLAHVQLWGNVAAVGLAASPDLPTTVMPFILRGVSLLGVSSANTPMPQREALWRDLGQSLKPRALEKTLARRVSFKDVGTACADLLARKVQGRLLVEINP